MPWGRVDDDFYDHPKVLGLGRRRLQCVGLYFLAISWTNRYLTDGKLDANRVRSLGGSIQVADRLVEAGLFDRDGDCYVIHDFLHRNKSRQQVETEREQKAEAGRKGGLARGGKRGASEADAKQSAKQTASTVLSKTQAPGVSPRPVPSESSTPTPLGAVDAPTAGESEETRLTRAHLDAWATFTEPAWEPFKTAWLGRGFRLPPFGNPDDEADTSQRARLWRIADDQPEALGRWVREAKGKTARDVIAHVFEQRAEMAKRAESEETTSEAERDARLQAPVPADWFERPTS